MPTFTTTIHHSADAIPREVWARLCPPNHPFLNADFLTILERHGAAGRECGWVAQHLLASDEHGTVIGLLPLYMRFNSHGDFIHDWSWAAAYQQLGRVYYPKLLSGLPHTPAAGPRLLVADGPHAQAIRQTLIDGALALAAEYGVSSWHVAFPDENDQAALHDGGLLTSHNVQFHWLAGDCGDFDDYLATFTAEKRRKVKAERRRVRESGLTIEVRHGDEVDPAEWPARRGRSRRVARAARALRVDLREIQQLRRAFGGVFFRSGTGIGAADGRLHRARWARTGGGVALFLQRRNAVRPLLGMQRQLS